MKNIISLCKHYLLPALFICVIAFATSCTKDSSGTGAPVITGLRTNRLLQPGSITVDSMITSVGPGAWVTILGKNLRGATQIFFNGVAASFNEGLFSDTSAVVQVPVVIPFPSIPAAQQNTIRYVTTHGETTFTFPINAPAPTISSVSNEYARPGQVLTIYGNNLFFIDKVTFPGNIDVTTLLSSATDGTNITITVPANLTTGGVLKVTNRYGVGTSVLLFNDFTTGMLANFEDGSPYFGWQYFAGTKTNDATLYPNNTGNYIRLNPGTVGANDFAWYNGGRAVLVTTQQWLPTASLTDTLDKYALKFNMYVKNTWTTGTLLIRNEGNWTYTYRYEPWKNTTGGFKTDGWITVTVPLNLFKGKSATGVNGDGAGVPSLAALLGNGQREVGIMLINDGTTPITNFDAAFDNVRIARLR